MWDALVAWFQSPGGARVMQTAIVPALAILVAGVLAALIARAAIRAVIRRSERAEASAAVAALVAAARAEADSDGDRGARRRAARLRTEADVRTRLLPLQGAAAAADWAAARIDAVQQQAAEGPVSRQLDELRDRLVEWVGRPAHAKRIFASPAAPARRSEAAPAVQALDGAKGKAETPASPAVEPTQQDAVPSEPDRSARATVAPGPRRVAPGAEPAAPAVPVAAPSAPAPSAPAHPAPAVAVATGETPAWQRTRAGERLQQERSRGRLVEAPTDEDETPALVSDGTAPMQVQHAHRAQDEAAPAPSADADEAARLEAHQLARHARPDQTPTGTTSTQEGTGAAPVAPAAGATPASAAPVPAWLDTYDDEAQVTQNLDLKTPPPVSATSLRDRGTSGENLLPRS